MVTENDEDEFMAKFASLLFGKLQPEMMERGAPVLKDNHFHALELFEPIGLGCVQSKPILWTLHHSDGLFCGAHAPLGRLACAAA
jgi:hypothetical protein